MCSVDGSFNEYLQRVDNAVCVETWRTQQEYLKISEKFDAHGPVNFPGVTVLTPPGAQDPLAQAVYAYLPGLMENITAEMPRCFHRVYPNSYHVTIADLLSGKTYLQHRHDETLNQTLLPMVE